MNFIIAFVATIVIIDTLIGNYIFPGKVEVIKNGSMYIVRKKTRILLIPIWRYLAFDYLTHRNWLMQFTFSKNCSATFRKETAIRRGKLYSNQLVKKPKDIDIIWSSKKKKEDSFKAVLLLKSKIRDAELDDDVMLLESLKLQLETLEI